MENHKDSIRAIALIGLPASGKTSVGAELARLVGLPFVDLDELVAGDAGCSISDIFEDEGEAGFRAREEAALARVAGGAPVVLATGGGCVELERNRGVLRKMFRVVWLKADLGTIARRAVGTSRPLLAGDAEGRIRSLYERRKPWYAECADIVIQTDGMRVGKVAEAINDAIR